MELKLWSLHQGTQATVPRNVHPTVTDLSMVASITSSTKQGNHVLWNQYNSTI